MQDDTSRKGPEAEHDEAGGRVGHHGVPAGRYWVRYWQLAALVIAAVSLWSPWQGTGSGLLALLGTWGLFALVAAWTHRLVPASRRVEGRPGVASMAVHAAPQPPASVLARCCRTLAEVCNVGVLVRDLKGWRAFNGRMERILEALGGAGAADGAAAPGGAGAPDAAAAPDTAAALLAEARGEGILHRATDAQGREQWFEVSGNEQVVLARQVGEPREAAGGARDPLHDLLTDLPNRLLLLDRLRQAILTEGREGRPVAVMVVSLNRFAGIADALGHHIGDAVLCGVADRLREGFRRSDTVARVGGDEFAVLLPGAGEDNARAGVDKVLALFEEPLQVQEHRIGLKVSVGMALYPRHGDDALALLRRADVAMYVAKRKALEFMLYDPEHDPQIAERLNYLHNLREAIDNGQFVLYFQPKVGLDSGQVGDVEALVRWQHPEHGIIGPDRFIPLAEQSGLIRPLTEWVLDKALEQCAAWRDQGLDIAVAVNVSAGLLQVGEFPATVEAALGRWRLPAKSLILEITETTIMDDPALALESLSRFSAMGVRLSIDDFGTGYSSMLYLKRLPVNELKIDKSFVRDMHKDDNDRIIVRATVDLAHNLGLKVIAEGVETERTRDMLAGIGCDMVQGYYYSRPLSAERFTPWLRDSNLREKAWVH